MKPTTLKQISLKQIALKQNNNLVNKAMNIVSFLALPLVIITLVSCSKATPVPKSECKAVINHVKSILKDKAPSRADMLKQCNVASDEARGCVMAANKPMKILQCDF